MACRLGEAADLVGSSVMCLKSSWMVGQECGVWTGTYLLRNMRLQRMILPGPLTHYILVKLTELNDDVCLVPVVGMWTCLVLNTHVVGNCKRW